MGTGYMSDSLRALRLSMAGLLLAILLTVTGVNLNDGMLVVDPPAAHAAEPNGSTGGG